MWDMHGLEALINITEAEKSAVMETLQGNPITWRNPLQHMILRAQANIQRHYEIYLFETDIDEVSIKELFECTPQVIVDSIREVGSKIYSARMTESERKPAIV